MIYLDCVSPVYADRAAAEPDARSAATEALFEAAQRLCTWQGTGGSFTFPRLFTGLAMIATGVADGSPNLVAAEIERYERLPQRQGIRALGAGDFWRGVLGGIIQNLMTDGPGQQGSAGAGPGAASTGNAVTIAGDGFAVYAEPHSNSLLVRSSSPGNAPARGPRRG